MASPTPARRVEADELHAGIGERERRLCREVNAQSWPFGAAVHERDAIPGSEREHG